MLLDGPGQPSIEVFHDAELDGNGLVITNSNLEGLGDHGVIVVAMKVRLPPLADQVEGVASVDAQGLVFRRVINGVLSDELQVPVGVPAVEADAAFGQGNAQPVLGGVDDLPEDGDFGVGLRPISGGAPSLSVAVIVLARVQSSAVIDVEDGGRDALGVDELDLLGLAVAQRRGPLQRV